MSRENLVFMRENLIFPNVGRRKPERTEEEPCACTGREQHLWYDVSGGHHFELLSGMLDPETNLARSTATGSLQRRSAPKRHRFGQSNYSPVN